MGPWGCFGWSWLLRMSMGKMWVVCMELWVVCMELWVICELGVPSMCASNKMLLAAQTYLADVIVGVVKCLYKLFLWSVVKKLKARKLFNHRVGLKVKWFSKPATREGIFLLSTSPWISLFENVLTFDVIWYNFIYFLLQKRKCALFTHVSSSNQPPLDYRRVGSL